MSVVAAQSGSSQRAITLRARGDLVISTTVFQGQTSWIVKDPIGLKYFRLREAEREVLRLLDGQHSYDDIRRHLARRFPNKKFDVRQLQQLVQSFHSNGMLLSNAQGQAEPLNRRYGKQRQQKAMQLLSSIVSIKFPGIDPDPSLEWLYPKVAWFFSRTVVAVCLCVICGALLLIGTQLDEFGAKLPEFQQFFGVNNLIYLGFVLVATKSLHEFGHGLVCKHFNGECHEMGFMLMVLTPAMYCDTSDSWILPNKWHRIAIGAAGMWVEVVLAAVATFAWWYTHPGWLHYLALNIMFLCSVATVVFNINPLLRYDGYYMLSDYLEIPNLSQQSNLALVDRLRVWCLGMESMGQGRLPEQQQIAFAIYSVASFCYRWFVLLMIFWFLTRVFEPYGWQVIGYRAITMSIVGSVAMPIVKAIKFFLIPGRLREVKRPRAMATAVVLALLLFCFFLVPLPHHVMSDFVVRPADAQRVFVEWPGNLREIEAEYGSAVQAGDVIARLENPDLELLIMELQSESDRQQTLLDSYRVNVDDPLTAARLAGEARAKLTQIKKQLVERTQQRDHLLLTAHRDGWVIPPPNLPEPVHADGQLTKWSGSPLDAENVSALLDRETLACYVGDPSKMKAMLCLTQGDMKFLQPDQTVELVFNSFRGDRIAGHVQSVSNKSLDVLPRELSASNGGGIAAAPQPDGSERPLLTMFEAAVGIPDSPIRILPGMIGKAKIRVGQTPLATRLFRHAATVFIFQ